LSGNPEITPARSGWKTGRPVYCLNARLHGNERERTNPYNRDARSPMEFAQELLGDVVIVKLSGRLDSGTAQPAEESFTGVLGGGALRLAIDMSNLEYISSAGLRVLLVVAKKVQQAKGKVVLFGLVRNVREVFSISGFDRIFAIQSDMAAALEAVR
jgi:anti-anti-sigma factor